MTFGPLGRAWGALPYALAAAWPVPLPVLAIEQAWVNGGVEVLGCRHTWTWNSDHRPVVADTVLP